MRGKDLLECMECIDDALIQEALESATVSHEDKYRYKFNIAAGLGAAAVCIVVVGISVMAFWSHQNIRDEQMDSASPMAMDTSGGNDHTGNLPENSQTAGAVAESAQADIDELSADNVDDAVRQDTAEDTASSKRATVMDMKSEEVAEEESRKLAYTIISDYYDKKDNSVYDYPVPDKGAFFCYHYLQETMEYYATLEDTTDTTDGSIYAYDVVIDVFGDVKTEGNKSIHYERLSMLEDTNVGNELIEQEYMRLEQLGYAVRLSEDFQLTGTFTKAEIDTFQASPEYGYTFRFANEF